MCIRDGCKGNGLKRPSLQRRLHCRWDQGHIRHQRCRLFDRIILPEGHQIDIFPHRQFPQITQRGRQPIVGGGCDHQRAAVAQMGLGRHSNAGIRDPRRQFGQRIAGTRGDDEHIQQLFRPDGLRIPDRQDRRATSILLCPRKELRRQAKTGVRPGGALRKDEMCIRDRL